MIAGEQPHRIVPERRRGRRVFPCGRTDGGFLFGDGDQCRAADVVIEDWVGPPLYTRSSRDKRIVTSTHTETKVCGVRDDGSTYAIHTLRHPDGLR